MNESSLPDLVGRMVEIDRWFVARVKAVDGTRLVLEVDGGDLEVDVRRLRGVKPVDHPQPGPRPRRGRGGAPVSGKGG